MKKNILILFLIPLFVSCATAYDNKGVYHKVGKGESINRIAKYYHVSVQELAEWNNIEDAKEIIPGLKLYLPESTKATPLKHKQLPVSLTGETAKPQKKVKAKAPKKKEYAVKSQKQEKIKFDRARFSWPINGRLVSPFGIRNGRRHDGIDIAAKSGTPINAAAKGNVVFSGKLRGYGNIVILRHKDNFFTVYAHNKKNKVKKGRKVAKGDIVGYVGATGRASGPHVHFEVRQGDRARNPLFLLPAKANTNVQYAKTSKKSKKSVKATKTEKTKTRFSRREAMMEKLKQKDRR